ncbi:Rieske 2Fe-2S domain-containing protein [Bernardetia sp. MNP-M8]|uniref:Rieske (2Fe-2S) protein n=1 Tax=Bernardetia sp. MNP-M8 TaxID=3127470 RepID=UPI0030CE416C
MLSEKTKLVFSQILLITYTLTKLFDSEQEAKQKIALGTSILLTVSDANNEDEKICLSHTKDGFFAVQNNCSHAGADLHKGFINEQNEIVCPLHSYCFNLKTGNSTRGNAPSLKTYRLEWKNDEVTNQKVLFIDV